MLRVVADSGSTAHLELIAHIAALGPFSFYGPSIHLKAIAYARRVSPRAVTVAVMVIAGHLHLNNLRRSFGGQTNEPLVALVAEEDRRADDQHPKNQRDDSGDHAADYFSWTKEQAAQRQR